MNNFKLTEEQVDALSDDFQTALREYRAGRPGVVLGQLQFVSFCPTSKTLCEAQCLFRFVDHDAAKKIIEILEDADNGDAEDEDCDD